MDNIPPEIHLGGNNSFSRVLRESSSDTRLNRHRTKSVSCSDEEPRHWNYRVRTRPNSVATHELTRSADAGVERARTAQDDDHWGFAQFAHSNYTTSGYHYTEHLVRARTAHLKPEPRYKAHPRARTPGRECFPSCPSPRYGCSSGCAGVGSGVGPGVAPGVGS
eukprot:3941923-Pyramimonas_sp.AAC.2